MYHHQETTCHCSCELNSFSFSSSSSSSSSSSDLSFSSSSFTTPLHQQNQNHQNEFTSEERLLSPLLYHKSNVNSIHKKVLLFLTIISTTMTATNAISIQRHANVVFSSSSSSNALALLNTARHLREQQHQEQEQEQQKQKHQLKLQRYGKDSISKYSSFTYYGLFDDDGEEDDDEYNTQQQLSSAIMKQLQTRQMSTTRVSTASAATEEENENNLIHDKVEKQLPTVKSLLKTSSHSGNDIPDMELHLQMEAARARGKDLNTALLAFMDLHHHDRNGEENKNYNNIANNGNKISAIEKVAMSTLPSQLPGLAAPMLKNNSSASTSSRNSDDDKKRRGTFVKSLQANKDKKATLSTSDASSASSSSSTKTQTVPILKKSKSTKDEKKLVKKTHPTNTIKNIQTKEVSNIMTARKSLSERQQQRQPHTTSLSSPSITRVSHDEEIHLARIIQRGSELNNIKTKFEQENNREITRQEWAELANVESPKELRRVVSDYRKAKNKLVIANMGLVHAVVRTRMREFGRGSVSYEGISYEEMVQEGSLGLLRAAELFDPSRGLRFSTYATIWIKGILGNSSLSEAITLPLREKNKWNKIQQAIEDISAEKAVDENGVDYKPTEEEIGSKCGLEPDEVKTVMTKMKRAKNVLSLDYQYDSSSRSGMETDRFDALSNDKNMMDDVDLVERLQFRADIVAALTRNLDAREARLMRLRYGLNDGKTRSINDCAEAMGISKARAQQLAAGCLKKLREADDAESLQEYLLSVA